MARLRRPRFPARTVWGPWVHHGEAALFYGDPETGQEVPLDRIVTPHELWQTLYHYGLEQDFHEQNGVPYSARRRALDTGSLIVAIHDRIDVWSVYRRGMDTDAPDSYANFLTRRLLELIEELPAEPSRDDYATLGARIADTAFELNAAAFFGR